VKVIDKKRSYYLILRNLSLRIPHKIPQASMITSMINNRVIWYSVSLLLYFWFLYWIAFDIFVWHKPITQVSTINYAGAITAMALIWIGTKLPTTFKHTLRVPKKHETPIPQDEPKKETQPKKRKHTSPKPTTQTPLSQPPPQLTQPEPQQHRLKQPTSNIPGCTHQFGYLHQPGKINDIPDECLTCQQVTKCLTQIKE